MLLGIFFYGCHTDGAETQRAPGDNSVLVDDLDLRLTATYLYVITHGLQIRDHAGKATNKAKGLNSAV